MQLCHSNDFGSLQLKRQFSIWVLALLFAFQLATYSGRRFAGLSKTLNRRRGGDSLTCINGVVQTSQRAYIKVPVAFKNLDSINLVHAISSIMISWIE
jgi:hypothetical protein